MADASRIVPPIAALIAALLTAAPPAHARELTDPTRPPAAYTATPGGAAAGEATDTEIFEWRLNATYTTRGHRRAVINGRHVTEGDRLGEAEVVTIRPGNVELREGKEVFSLSIHPDTMKGPASGNPPP